VVGDPFQSIYRFRGADPRLLVEFPRAFEGAQVLVLEQNYRSTRTVVALANALVAPLAERPASWTANPAGPPARVYAAVDDADEARFVSAEVARLLRAGDLAVPGQAAVLFRTNAQARALALAFRTRGIPMRLRTELDLLACAEVKDLLAYLRLAHSPGDSRALARILNTPPRRLRSIEHAFRSQPVPVDELPAWAIKCGGTAARTAVEKLMALLNEIHALAATVRPEAVLDLVLERTGYGAWMGGQANRRGHLEHVQALMIWARAVSLPTLVALKINEPVLFSVAPMTLSPGCFSTGMDSPLSMDSSTDELPSSTVPSTAIFSPGCARTASPGRTSVTSTSRSIPSVVHGSRAPQPEPSSLAGP
jgi:DNA helicase-2/ATP-dependent DNA helicase PcrA